MTIKNYHHVLFYILTSILLQFVPFYLLYQSTAKKPQNPNIHVKELPVQTPVSPFRLWHMNDYASEM
jgi:hypothetical protein